MTETVSRKVLHFQKGRDENEIFSHSSVRARQFEESVLAIGFCLFFKYVVASFVKRVIVRARRSRQ